MHSLPRKSLWTILAALVVLAAAAAVPAVAGARPSPAGFVYVNDNTSGTNTVAGFARGEDGQLVPLPGSPFDTGGTSAMIVQ